MASGDREEESMIQRMDRERDSGCADSALQLYPQRIITPGAVRATADGRCGLEHREFGARVRLERERRALMMHSQVASKESSDSEQDIAWVTSVAHQHRVTHWCDYGGFASLVERCMADLGASVTRHLIVRAYAWPIV